MRLANLYIKMCAAGSVLFQDWSVYLNCDKTAKCHTQVNFGLARGTLTSKKGSMIGQMHSLSDFMEKCYMDWQKYLEEKR